MRSRKSLTVIVSLVFFSFSSTLAAYQEWQEYNNFTVQPKENKKPEEKPKEEKPKEEKAKEEKPKEEKKEDKKEEKPKEPAFLVPLSMDKCGRITFQPGLRIQTRYTYDGETNNHDIFLRRFRLKASGEVFDFAKYGAELKIDDTGRFSKDPKAQVENAWVDFCLCKNLSYLRVGLYDLPFSRNALTSDSKLLFMDRSLIKDALTDLGMADNTIGLLWHGRPYGGQYEYAVGIFDNIAFERIGSDGPRNSHELMPAGRFVINFLDPATPPDGYADYMGSYLCEGERLALGFNAAYLGHAEDEDLDEKFDLWAWGTDIFYNSGCFTFESEFDGFKRSVFGDEDVVGYGWYVQAGYIYCWPFEIALRYQELKPDIHESNNRLRWTTLGVNYYWRKHNLKVQSDYTIKREQGEDNHNLFQIQLQLDF